MAPLLERRALSELIFVDPDDADAVAQAEAELRRTEITQPAVLAADIALTRLLGAYGITPDFVMGHSLGEYGALVAAGVLSFADALEAVSARGSEMASLDVEDPGAMAAVSAPLAEVEEVVAEVDGYVVVANVNSTSQLVLGGATDGRQGRDRQAGRARARRDPAARQPRVPHRDRRRASPSRCGDAAPAHARRRRRSRWWPTSTASFYPSGPGIEEQIVELLGRQVASPVQFVNGLHTLHDAGARVFVETGPKRALWGFAADVLGDDAVSLVHQPSQARRPDLVQPRAVRAVRRRARYRVLRRRSPPAAATPAPPAAPATSVPVTHAPSRSPRPGPRRRRLGR